MPSICALETCCRVPFTQARPQTAAPVSHPRFRTKSVPLIGTFCGKAIHTSKVARNNKNSVRVRAELEEVDPTTGEVLTGTSARAPLASETVQVGGLTWAYRTSNPEESIAKEAGEEPVILLHGIGSSSYSYREVVVQLASSGYRVYAPDFIGHGNSSKPSPAEFAYDEESYKRSIGAFIDAISPEKPVRLVVQGYILAQYALLWALDNPDRIDKLVILNTPLSTKAKLPPYLAPYKNPLPFLRPKGTFAADMHNAGGSAYVMQRRDADVYMQPYVDDAGANEALAAALDKCDLKALLEKVDEGFRSWRKDTLVLFGGSDRYLEQKSVFDFLETKRTCIKLQTFEAKVGHMPQEDYPEVLCNRLVDYYMGREQRKVSPGTRIPGNFTDSPSA
uniref:Haloalkane dehalogenase n=1 Tax=Tetraselmis sp. GSL018 TaxID=582737 RepID=A0A061QYM8_9CHLO|mmetsp:Transcript_7743/g.18548  ORF Transcript_7743/g.18548 Transcript_7743/m.18548 type:complete len:392 (-) Transcript_7743:189-1364(-)